MRRFWAFLAVAGTLLAQRAPLETAWDLAAKGQTAKAVALLEELTGKEPRNGEARLLLGSLLASMGKAPESLKQLQAAVRLLPNSAEAHDALGEAYHAALDIDHARPEFELAVKLSPNLAQAQSNLGMALGELGELPAAAQHLDRAIKLLGSNPDAAVPHFLRAKVYTQEGLAEKAAAELALALKLRPDLAAAWSDLGQARKAQQDDVGAFAAFEHAATLDPRDASAQARLGAEYLHRGQPHEAVQHLQQAISVDASDQTALFNLQRALHQDSREAEARAVSKQLAEIIARKDEQMQNHLTANRLNNEGVKLQQTGDLKGALPKYSAAHELNPESGLFRFNMAVALLRVGRWKEGLAELHTCMDLEPDNTKLKAVWDDAIRQAPPGSWTGDGTAPSRVQAHQ